MVRVTAEVEGMMCGMCESHIQDAIRKGIPEASKIKANRGKGTASFLLEENKDRNELEVMLHAAIDPTGYTLKSVKEEPYDKKRLGFFKK
ncbi:MAG: heavy metal-associated domain-containing protein [Eubacterium sp.]|nr:heavy metal-associated domain-containing protein [Eubacterium sp.]